MAAVKSPFAVSDSVSSRVFRTLLKTAKASILSWFTLVELIVVITILAILATIGFLALGGYSQDAKDASVKANVRSVYTAISSESAITNNSPRYYVMHDPAAALTGAAVAYVDGSPATLTGGDWNVSGTNYSAGNPDWAKLKLNPEKFRLSSLSPRLAAALGTAEAAYDPKAVSVWAVDAALVPTATGRNRSASFFQVAGTAPATGLVAVAGNFPAPTAAQVSAGAVLGLVKAPNGTGALVDGNSAGTSGSSSGGGASTPAFVPGTAYAAGQTFVYTLPDSGETVTVTVQGTGVGAVSSAASSSCTEGGVPAKDIAIWWTSGNPQVWAACNAWASNPMPYANMKFDGATDDTNVSTAQYSGGFYKWGDNTDVRPAQTWSSTANTNNDAWGNTTNTNAARQGPCPAGYHVPNGGMNAALSNYDPAKDEWGTAYSIAATAGAGTSCDPATVTNQSHRFRCLLRLPRSGLRSAWDGSVQVQGSQVYYWSSSPSSPGARSFFFHASGGWVVPNVNRAYGYSVRCLKN